jgi:hypothetical protein
VRQVAKFLDSFKPNNGDFQMACVRVLGPDFFDQGLPDSVRIFCEKEGQVPRTL